MTIRDVSTLIAETSTRRFKAHALVRIDFACRCLPDTLAYNVVNWTYTTGLSHLGGTPPLGPPRAAMVSRRETKIAFAPPAQR